MLKHPDHATPPHPCLELLPHSCPSWPGLIAYLSLDAWPKHFSPALLITPSTHLRLSGRSWKTRMSATMPQMTLRSATKDMV